MVKRAIRHRFAAKKEALSYGNQAAALPSRGETCGNGGVDRHHWSDGARAIRRHLRQQRSQRNTTFTLGNTATTSDATVVRFGGTAYDSADQQFGTSSAAAFLAATQSYTAVSDPNSVDNGYGGLFNGTSYLDPAAAINSQVGYYIYTTTFTGGASAFTMNGGVRADNGIYDVIFDYGQADQSVMSLVADSSGNQSGVRTPNNVAGSTNFLSNGLLTGSGTHTLSYVIYNADGPTGVDFTATVSPVPEPGIVVTAVSMFGLTGLGMVRGRRRRK